MTRGVIFLARLVPEKTLAAFHRECDQNANARATSIYGLWRKELPVTFCPHTAEIWLHTIHVLGASN
jgi:hypothetical protein